MRAALLLLLASALPMLASAASDVGTSDATFPLVIVAFAVVGVVLIVAVVLTSKLPAMTRAHEKHVDFVHLMTSKTRELAERKRASFKRKREAQAAAAAAAAAEAAASKQATPAQPSASDASLTLPAAQQRPLDRAAFRAWLAQQRRPSRPQEQVTVHDNPDEHIQFKAGKLLRDELLAKSIARLRLTFPQLMELRESLIQHLEPMEYDVLTQLIARGSMNKLSEIEQHIAHLRRLFGAGGVPAWEYLSLLALCAGSSAVEKLELLFQLHDTEMAGILSRANFRNLGDSLFALALRPATAAPKPPATPEELSQSMEAHLAVDSEGYTGVEEFVDKGAKDAYLSTILDLALGVQDAPAFSAEQRTSMAGQEMLPPLENRGAKRRKSKEDIQMFLQRFNISEE